MFQDKQYPLRPAKIITRRLRNASDRLARNNLLSSIVPEYPSDVE